MLLVLSPQGAALTKSMPPAVLAYGEQGTHATETYDSMLPKPQYFSAVRKDNESRW